MPSGPVTLFIQLPGIAEPKLLRAQWSDYPDDVIDTIITKFKQRFSGVEPDQLHLFKLGDDGSSRILLEPMQTLADAGLFTGTGGTVKLLVELVTEGACSLPRSCARLKAGAQHHSFPLPLFYNCSNHE